MSVTSGFFNSLNGDRRYNAEQMSAIFDGIINDGVFASIGTAFGVRANGNYNITVGIGRAWFNSTWLYNDSILPLTTDVSELLLDRYDAVIIEIDRTESVRRGSIKVVKGEPSDNPQYPTLVKTTGKYQYPLAYIHHKAGATEITQSDIINMIGTGSCPYVTAILEVNNIDNIVAQWESQWNDWTEEEKAAFDEWFTEIQNILSDEPIGELASRVLKLETEKLESEAAVDFEEAQMPEFQENINTLTEQVAEVKSDLSKSDFNIQNELGILYYGSVGREVTLFTSENVSVGDIIYYSFTADENSVGYLALYDENDTRIGYYGKTTLGTENYHNGSFTIPENFAYCKTYALSDYLIDIDYIKLNLLSDTMENVAKLETVKQEMVVKSKNISVEFVDGYANVTTGYVYIPSGFENGWAISASDIEVEAGETYCLGGNYKMNANWRVYEYAENGDFIGYSAIGYVSGTTFTVGDTTKKIRLQINNNGVEKEEFIPENFQMELGNKATSFVKNTVLNKDNIDANAQYEKLVKDGTIVDGFIVPDYFIPHLKERCARVNELMKTCAGSGDAFVFITDEHWTQNQKNSPALLRYVWDNCSINKLFSGGDNDDGGSFDYCKQLRRAWKGNVYNIAGNHEFFKDATDDEISYYFDMYNDDLNGNSKHHYYYVDNNRQKIRYVVVAGFYGGERNAFNGFAVDSEQMAWIENDALNVGSDWSVIILTHMFWFLSFDQYRTLQKDTRSRALMNLLDSYNSNGNKGKVICIVQGHTHVDRIAHTDGGIPIVMVTSDRNLAMPNDDGSTDHTFERLSGTTDEQAFDIVVIDKNNKSIHFVRVGATAQDGIDDAEGNFVTERVVIYS